MTPYQRERLANLQLAINEYVEVRARAHATRSLFIGVTSTLLVLALAALFFILISPAVPATPIADPFGDPSGTPEGARR